MWRYRNGDYEVAILDDGTKMRPDGDLHPVWPESLDVKITNRCDSGCPYCHESSTRNGESFDREQAYRLFADMPRGVELAIGGGNPLECVDGLRWLIGKMPGHILNVTVSARHLSSFPDDLGVTAIGVSYVSARHDEIAEFTSEHANCVVHLIAGVHCLPDLRRCLDAFDRVLVLGFKQVGRGRHYYPGAMPKSLFAWREGIGSHLQGSVLAFDNLAVQQLGITRFFEPDRWRETYMGDDGEFSMYLDLVRREYAVSSRSQDRRAVGELTIPEMFADVRERRAA